MLLLPAPRCLPGERPATGLHRLPVRDISGDWSYRQQKYDKYYQIAKILINSFAL